MLAPTPTKLKCHRAAQTRSIAATANALHAFEMQLQAPQTESEEHDAALAVESAQLEKLLARATSS